MAYLSCSAPQPSPAQVGNYDLKERGWWSSIHNFNLKYLEDSLQLHSFAEPFIPWTILYGSFLQPQNVCAN